MLLLNLISEHLVMVADWEQTRVGISRCGRSHLEVTVTAANRSFTSSSDTGKCEAPVSGTITAEAKSCSA